MAATLRALCGNRAASLMFLCLAVTLAACEPNDIREQDRSVYRIWNSTPDGDVHFGTGFLVAAPNITNFIAGRIPTSGFLAEQ